MKLIDEARNDGIDLTFDVYPYTAGSCGLKTLLPPWILERGIEADEQAMMESENRGKFKEDCKMTHGIICF